MRKRTTQSKHLDERKPKRSPKGYVNKSRGKTYSVADLKAVADAAGKLAIVYAREEAAVAAKQAALDSDSDTDEAYSEAYLEEYEEVYREIYDEAFNREFTRLLCKIMKITWAA